MNKKDVILTLERLELYMSAGMPLDRAMVLIGEGGTRKHRAIIKSIVDDVISGRLLSSSLEKHLRISPTLAGLIQHGESSGELIRSLCISRTMIEKQQDMLKKCTSALVYPVVIGIFALLLTVGLVRGVLPQITPMLRGLHVNLPLLTRVVISTSEHLVSYGLYMLGGAVTGLFVFIVLYSRVRRYKYLCQYLLIHIPIVGHALFSYSLSLFLQSFGSLVESGLPVSPSYTKTVRTVSLLPLQDMLHGKALDIEKGISCGTVLANISAKIPHHVPALLSAGEASGTLGSSLTRAASILDRDIDHALKRITSLIEPVMMVGMGCSVGSIALSIMMPIYDISKALQH